MAQTQKVIQWKVGSVLELVRQLGNRSQAPGRPSTAVWDSSAAGADRIAVSGLCQPDQLST
jgi:hypothetical protein